MFKILLALSLKHEKTEAYCIFLSNIQVQSLQNYLATNDNNKELDFLIAYDTPTYARGTKNNKNYLFLSNVITFKFQVRHKNIC